MVADAELTALLESFAVPVTRPQWAAWLRDNIGTVRAMMRTAPADRRQHFLRAFARPGLPAPVRRIQPQLDRLLRQAEWAQRLANRSGWWGLETRDNGVVILFLMVLRGRAYYMDMDNRAATGAPYCTLDKSFLLTGNIAELPQLEVALEGDEVSKVFEFKALDERQITYACCFNATQDRSLKSLPFYRKPFVAILS